MTELTLINNNTLLVIVTQFALLITLLVFAFMGLTKKRFRNSAIVLLAGAALLIPLGVSVHHNISSTTQQNVANLQTWSKENYDLNLNTEQAESLLKYKDIKLEVSAKNTYSTKIKNENKTQQIILSQTSTNWEIIQTGQNYKLLTKGK